MNKYGIQEKQVAKRSEDTLEVKADGAIAAKDDQLNPEPMWLNSKEEAQKIADKHPGFVVIEIVGAE